MTRGARQALVLGGALVGGALSAVALGGGRWAGMTRLRVAELAADRLDGAGERFTLDQLEGLPEPVARYFHFALTPGQSLVRAAVLEQRGEFRTGGPDSPWLPLTARQHFSAQPPGFVWDASIRMAPGVPVRVRDAYRRGAGSMQAQIAGVFSVVDQHDRPELNQGALQRYLAEAPWLPTALLPGPGLTWEAMDARTARATLTDGGLSVSMEFTFGDRGEIVRSFTPARFREVQGRYIPTPWGGTYHGYEPLAGMQIPREAEVSWFFPEGPSPYALLHVRSAQYGF